MLVLRPLLRDTLARLVLFVVVGVISASGWHPLFGLYKIWFIVANRIGLTCLPSYPSSLSLPQPRLLLIWR